jgi:predicted outer membrane repeat protein
MVIYKNTFNGNEAGQKGTAIYTRQITNLVVKANNFVENQPGYSFRDEAKVFPYYQLLSLGARPTLFAPPNDYKSVSDEFNYLSISSNVGETYSKYWKTYDNGGYIINLPKI